MSQTKTVSATPRTDAVREIINNSGDCHAEDICNALDFAELLERENAVLLAELKIHREADVELQSLLQRFKT